MKEIIDLIQKLPEDEQRELLEMLDSLNKQTALEAARTSFMGFVKYMWPEFIEGEHHQKVAGLFDESVDGDKKRIIINMPPRHTKSEFASIFLPAYFIGRFPNKKLMQASNTWDLASDFGGKVRDLVASPRFQEVFPGVKLREDAKAKGKWLTNARGEYFATGVMGNIAGRGADLFIIDDPHSEQDQVQGENNPEVYNKVMTWYETGPRQRLQPGGRIILVQTRWHQRDMTGQLIKKMQNAPEADQWEVVELPAILPSGKAMWPGFWSLEELTKTKNSISLAKWNAQYQQNPTSEEGALIKREYWQIWEEDDPPRFSFIMQAWDTAMTKNTRSDYSACTTWGVFEDEYGRNRILLIDAFRGKWEFPELKKIVKESYKEWDPDVVLIEAKAAGLPLIQEFGMMNIPVDSWTPARGTVANPNDKISRVNAITDVFASGNVYTRESRWAEEVIEECASFPAGEHDDYLDTVAMAVTRFRNGGWVGTDRDEDMEPKERQVKRYY